MKLLAASGAAEVNFLRREGEYFVDIEGGQGACMRGRAAAAPPSQSPCSWTEPPGSEVSPTASRRFDWRRRFNEDH